MVTRRTIGTKAAPAKPKTKTRTRTKPKTKKKPKTKPKPETVEAVSSSTVRVRRIPNRPRKTWISVGDCQLELDPMKDEFDVPRSLIDNCSSILHLGNLEII